MATAVFSGCLMGSGYYFSKRVPYRDKFVGLASINAGQRQHLTHPSRNKITFMTIYDAPCEMLDSDIHHRLTK